MTVLVIDEATEAAIAKLIAYAEKHKMSVAVMEKIVAGTAQPAGNNPNFVCYIEHGYQVVFTIEEQPFGWARHISISVPKNYPHPSAVEMIMKLFGFKKGIDGITAGYLEKDSRAINLIEKIEE